MTVMLRTRPLAAALAMSMLTAVVSPTAIAADGSLDERVGRLERLLESQVLNEMLDRMTRLQREVQQLRGQLEEANHQIEGVRKRQRELYLDVDRRLNQVERAGATAPAAKASEAPVAPEPVAAVSVDPLLEQRAYESAFKLLTDGRHAQAKTGFQAYLEKYPKGDYADESQYWLGEIGYQTRDFDFALAEFKKLTENFPQSTKMPNALLKSGFVYYEKGDKASAKSVLEDVVKRFPDTTAARLAGNRLQLIKREGG
ncbi:MAG: tol-pal system protein YbgF [Gammaproteobacteria bacterium]|nr:tol-pal system protein YbgF [Gammaproteobacteria bacterium]MCP5137925.1 tol-pal system protein YbgF [Gammaproteobacteria bacterium]